MFLVIALLGIMGLMCTDLFVPSLPSLAVFFHQTPNHAQLTISLFLMTFSVSQLFYGPISDRVGRKMPLMIGVIIFVAGSVLCVTATSFVTLCIGRMVQGLGVGAGLSLARVVLRDCYQGVQLAVKSSHLAILVSLTPALAPFIGGFLQSYFGFRSSFVFMFLYGVLLLFLLVFFFKETIQQKNKTLSATNVATHYLTLLRNMAFLRYVLIAGLAFSAIILSANVMPFIIQNQLHLSATNNGEIILLSALGISTAAFVSSKIVHRVAPQKLVLFGLYAFSVCGALLTISQYYLGTTLICLIPCIFVIMFACGLIFPNALAICFSQVNVNIGIAGAAYGSMQMLTSMITNFILNTISHQGQAMLGGFYVAMGLIGLILVWHASLHAKTKLKYAAEPAMD